MRFDELRKDFSRRRSAEPPVKKTPWFTAEWENGNDSLNDLLRWFLKNHGYEYLNTINGDVWFLYQGNWCRCEYEVSGSTVRVYLCESINN